MRGYRIGPGVGAATAAAGPVFLVVGWTAACIDGGTSGTLSDAAAMLALTPVAMVVGAMLAVLPNWCAATVLASIGCGNVGARLPVVWALVGAGAGGLVGTAAAGQAAAAIMAVVGAACALVCRRGTRWND